MTRALAGIALITCLLSGCNSDTSPQPKVTTQPEQKVWVFAQFNVPEEGEKLDSYWYYGRMSASLYQDIYSNKVKEGFVRLTNIHYWGDDDFVHPYEDDDYEGEMLFKIEDLRKATLVKRPPRLKEQHENILEDMDVEETPDVPETLEAETTDA